MIEKYTKRPVTIEAVQLLNDNDSIIECIEFVFQIGMETCMFGQMATIDNVKRSDGFEIPTLEGKMKASFGDYIIKGIEGEFYPCKEEIFNKSYIKVEQE